MEVLESEQIDETDERKHQHVNRTSTNQREERFIIKIKYLL
jgi:hypothetical protein